MRRYKPTGRPVGRPRIHTPVLNLPVIPDRSKWIRYPRKKRREILKARWANLNADTTCEKCLYPIPRSEVRCGTCR